jgi:hypothetical protein
MRDTTAIAQAEANSLRAATDPDPGNASYSWALHRAIQSRNGSFRAIAHRSERRKVRQYLRHPDAFEADETIPPYELERVSFYPPLSGEALTWQHAD